MAKSPGTLEGWYALHDFRRIDWERFKALPQEEREAALKEASAFLSEAEKEPEGSTAVYNVLGHKADLMIIHLRPTVEELAALERGFAQTRLADFTTQPYSYVSVTELSLYEASARTGSVDPDEMMKDPTVLKRLNPSIPDNMPYACFYPMSKRRGELVNWYSADLEYRRVMMRQHGLTGRKFQEQIVQLITGSTGLDDWEWGVTLFGVDPLPIKKLVYEMRFDEVSAKYGEFASFHLGIRVPSEQLASLFQK